MATAIGGGSSVIVKGTRMRSALFFAMILTVATPAAAFAQEGSPSEPNTRLEAMAETLNDPATQAAMTSTVTAVVDAVLDIRVDKLAKAIEPLNGGKSVRMRGNTVRELAAQDDPNFDRRIEQGARTAATSVGSMAQALAVMLPELQKAAKKIGDAFPSRR